MIIKGKSRSQPSALAAHLLNVEKNERVELLETRGTIATDLRGALIEMDAYGLGTRCEKPLYHAAISPEPPHRLTREQIFESVDALEVKLGLTGHARAIVVHIKEGREHIHPVWSRIDLERMRSVSDSHNYRKHEEVARDLERRFGHDFVQGAHAERDGPDGKVQRPDRTPSRAELRQEERTGITGKQVKAEVTAAFEGSDGPDAFRAALEDAGYCLAKGDRRDFVVVDQAGGVHSLARRLAGMKAAELRAFMEPLDRGRLPDIEGARELQFARAHGEQTAEEAKRWDEALAAAGVDRERRDRDEDSRRRREVGDDRASNRLEAGYGRSDGYVAQSRAARRDHDRRQAKLDERSNGRTTWDRAEAEKLDQLRRDRSGAVAAGGSGAVSEPTVSAEKQRRLDQLNGSQGGGFAAPEELPNRQPGAPGGGHPRSR